MQSNSYARASRYLVHFFDVHGTTTTWNLQMGRLSWWTYDDKFSFLFFTQDKILKNSTPGKIAYIRQIERVQIDTIEFEKTQIHFFSDVFIAAVFAPAA